MVAVAASPTPGAAAGSPFAARSHDHPPYKDMVLSALEALKGRKGSSRHAISKHIADNYSDLPPTHSSLLSHQLRRLHSKGVIRMSKHSYKLGDLPAAGDSGADVGSKKRGRPRKNAQPVPSVFDSSPRRRGRPLKVGADATPAKKIRLDQLPKPRTPAVVDPAAVYILPQAEQLRSGFLQSLPGAVAIVLPEGLLSKKTAKSPVLILPNGVQSLVDSSAGKKKRGRPRKIEVKKKPDQPTVVDKSQRPLSRRKAVLPKQVLVHNRNTNVNYINSGIQKLGRSKKVRDSEPQNGHLKSSNPDNFVTTETEQGEPEKAGNSTLPESVQALQNIPLPELKKRPVRRPKKNTIVEGCTKCKEVSAIGSHAWGPSLAGTETYTSLYHAYSNDDPEESMRVGDVQCESSGAKQHSNHGRSRPKRKRSNATFIREQISQLVSTRASMTTGAKNVRGGPSMADAVKILDSIAEIFDDMQLYLFSLNLLEDPTKREVFLTMSPERRVHYLRYLMQGSIAS